MWSHYPPEPGDDHDPAEMGPDTYDPKIRDVPGLPSFHGQMMWAAWNGCQGIFTCSVRRSRKEVERDFATYEGAGCSIVPVYVFVAPSEEWGYCDLTERDREKWS